MKKYLGFLIIVGLLSFVGLVQAEKELDNSDTICTQDAKQCPDGSYVSRTGPRCEYTACPGEAPRNSKERERKEEMMKKTRKEVFLTDIKKDRESFLTELKTKKEEWKTADTEKKKDFCEKAKEMVTKKFEVATTELEKSQTRIGIVIEKLKKEGKNTTLAQESLDLSKQKLAEAKTKLTEVRALIPTDCITITPEIFEKIKLGARVAKDLLKESKDSLHQAIKEIKNLRGENVKKEEKEVE